MSSLAETPEYQAFLRFIDLKVEQRQLQSRLDEIKETVKAMQPALLAYLAAAGLQSLTLNGYMVLPQREPWIYPMRGVSRQRVCEALKMAGLGRMVSENYSTQSLTKYVKDLEDHSRLITGLDENVNALERLLHPALAEILHVQASYSLHIRKKEDPYAKYAHPPQGDETDES